jgi:hypothetical protein
MTAAIIEYTIEETAVESHERGVADLTDVTAWLDHSANLRRPFTGIYVPRHRADGPAL